MLRLVNGALLRVSGWARSVLGWSNVRALQRELLRAAVVD